MLIRNEKGIVEDLNKMGTENQYGIFYYKDGDDTNIIEQTCPLLFTNIENLSKEAINDIEERLESGPIVIRKIRILDIC